MQEYLISGATVAGDGSQLLRPRGAGECGKAPYRLLSREACEVTQVIKVK
jgi:hypothetical protein